MVILSDEEKEDRMNSGYTFRDVGSLGQSGVTDFQGHHGSEILESFEAPYGVGEISFHTDELYSTCPVTGQPDFSSVDIVYMPNARCIESKSLKLYFQSFKNQGTYVEQLASDICDMVVTSVIPMYVRVKVSQSVRGGITTTADSTHISCVPESTIDRTWDRGQGFVSRELVEHDYFAQIELGGIGNVSHKR